MSPPPSALPALEIPVGRRGTALTGFQTVGALAAAVTVGWALSRGEALKQLTVDSTDSKSFQLLYFWIRFVIPGAILAVGIWWLLTEVLGVVGGV